MECDLFCLSLGSAPFFELRFRSIVFKYIYIKECHDISNKVECFFDMFEFFKSNTLLLSWLEYILAIGNYLNGTSVRYYLN